MIHTTTSEDDFQNCLNNNLVVHFQRPYQDDTHEFYTNLAESVGELCPMEESLVSGSKTGDLWTDIRFDPTVKNSYRHSNTKQPLHTDGSYESKAPNVSFFYCIESADYGGETIFISRPKLEILLEKYDKELLEQLRLVHIIFAKGDDKKTRPVVTEEALTWNYFRADQSRTTTTLIKRFKSFLDHVEDCHEFDSVRLLPGDAVFFWDEKMLHGRNAFFGNRWLKKGGVNCPIGKFVAN